MADLLLSFAGVGGASVGLFVLCRRATENRSATVRNALAILTMLLGAAYFVFLWDQALLARIVPHPALIVLGNWFPLFAAVLCGLAWTSLESPIRRLFTSSALGITALLMLIAPLAGEPPACGDRWMDNVCLQTTKHTCSPASAATLLRKYGIEASESEMSLLCLTRQGTSWQGLYRGLSLKTEGTPWQVEVFDGTFEDLRSIDSAPAILVTRLPDALSTDSQMTEVSGWVPGPSHSLVFSHFLDPRTIVMNDPSFGRELWRLDDLKTLWTGRAIRLVPRTQESTLAGILRAAL